MNRRLVYLLWNVERHTEIRIISRETFLQSETCNMRSRTIAIPALLDCHMNAVSMTSYAFEYGPPCSVLPGCFHAVEFVVRVE
jgi:hypothetical protein